MNIIDLILCIFLLLGLVRGLFKGFVVELAGLLALIAGVYAAIHFSHFAFELLTMFFSWSEKVISILSFAITFIIVVLVISLIARIITKMLNLLALGLVNRMLGGVFGVLKMAFLASLFLMFLINFDLFKVDKESEENSILYEPVRQFAPLILPTIIKEIQEERIFNPTRENASEDMAES